MQQPPNSDYCMQNKFKLPWTLPIAASFFFISTIPDWNTVKICRQFQLHPFVGQDTIFFHWNYLETFHCSLRFLLQKPNHHPNYIIVKWSASSDYLVLYWFGRGAKDVSYPNNSLLLQIKNIRIPEKRQLYSYKKCFQELHNNSQE